MITAMPRIAIAVHDYATAVETFRSTFGMPYNDLSGGTAAQLGAHVGMCVPTGGSNIELMAPANPDLPLSQALQKFLDRRGEGLYALMLEAPDPDTEADGLAGRGLDVLPLMAGAGGRDVHPRSTGGVLIRVYPNDSAPSGGPHTSAEPGLTGIVEAIVATADAGETAAAYRHGFGLATDDPVKDPDRGVLSVRCRAPKGGDIELVSPIDPGAGFAGSIADFLATTGGGLYALVLEADDPARARELLAERGVTRGGHDGDELTAFGTRFLIRDGGSAQE